MITTSTGAKKLESSDNWREIFPNPGTSAAGAHNATVDAQDRIQAEVAPIINGKRCSVGAASGEYVLLRNSTIAGKTDGAYKATKAIPADTDLDSTYLGSPITGGMVNELNSKITPLEDIDSKISNTLYNYKSGHVVTFGGYLYQSSEVPANTVIPNFTPSYTPKYGATVIATKVNGSNTVGIICDTDKKYKTGDTPLPAGYYLISGCYITDD